jgi:hypothetical protein
MEIHGRWFLLGKLGLQRAIPGAIKDGLWLGIWKAKVENKCRFFIWLLLQARLPMADRIANHGGHANSVCTLCRTNAETHLHMVAQCSYTKAVWQKNCP